jgi:hypothetical protein
MEPLLVFIKEQIPRVTEFLTTVGVDSSKSGHPSEGKVNVNVLKSSLMILVDFVATTPSLSGSSAKSPYAEELRAALKQFGGELSPELLRKLKEKVGKEKIF